MRLVAYLSHQIGVGNGNDMVHRQDNIANAAAWVRFLVTSTRWAICCPWYPYVVALDEQHRTRGIVDNIAILERCDILLQCGGRISAHMEVECQQAVERGVTVVDLTDLGYQPPWSMAINEFSLLIGRRADAALRSAPRAAWMPRLSQDQVRTLEEGTAATSPRAGEILHDIIEHARVPRT